MTLASPKGSQTMAYRKPLSSIAASIGGLAMFLILGSVVLVSQPIGSTVRGYFYSIDYARTISAISRANETVIDSQPRYTDINDLTKANLSRSSNGPVNMIDKKQPYETPSSLQGDKEAVNSSGLPIISSTRDMADQLTSVSTLSSGSTQEEQATEGSVSSNGTGDVENAKPPSLHLPDKPTIIQTESNDTSNTTPISSYTRMEGAPTFAPGNRIETGSVYSDCDLYHGKWVYDSAGPLYSNDSCPVLTQMQNCQGNGRPDKEYENWRWKPAQCDLPRFDAKKFLELMRGKTLAFIGDSVARNQMESMLCILWQVEVPKNRGNKRMQRYYFRSTSTTIVRIWSSWLVRRTSEPFDFAPEGVDKLHLDAADDNFMEFIPTFDVIVLSSGHWFAKQSVYILNNQIVGGQLWWPDNSKPKKINNIEAFGISVETILTAIGTLPNYTGLIIVRSYSPDHYEGGAWNTGGSCTGQVRPVLDGQLVENGFTNIMHEKQVTGFNLAIKKTTNKSKLRLMDITEAFGYRHDGHPGPYRSPDPNKITKRGPHGKPPPQDCLHWCMPGPVDTWNELVLEIIRRDFDGSQTLPS